MKIKENERNNIGRLGLDTKILVNTVSVFLFLMFVWYSDWLWAGRSEDRIPVEARFSAPVQTCPGPHPVSYNCIPSLVFYGLILGRNFNLNTLRTGLLNCLNARSRGLAFRHLASCI